MLWSRKLARTSQRDSVSRIQRMLSASQRDKARVDVEDVDASAWIWRATRMGRSTGISLVMREFGENRRRRFCKRARASSPFAACVADPACEARFKVSAIVAADGKAKRWMS